MSKNPDVRPNVPGYTVAGSGQRPHLSLRYAAIEETSATTPIEIGTRLGLMFMALGTMIFGLAFIGVQAFLSFVVRNNPRMTRPELFPFIYWGIVSVIFAIVLGLIGILWNAKLNMALERHTTRGNVVREFMLEKIDELKLDITKYYGNGGPEKTIPHKGMLYSLLWCIPFVGGIISSYLYSRELDKHLRENDIFYFAIENALYDAGYIEPARVLSKYRIANAGMVKSTLVLILWFITWPIAVFVYLITATLAWNKHVRLTDLVTKVLLDLA